MSIEKRTITPDQRDRILALEESHFVDLKATEVAPSKLTEFISAFANSDGGELYIGIDEIGSTKFRRWRGFSNIEAANGHIQIFETLFPLGTDFEYTFLACEGESGLVLKINIHKTREIKRASDGFPYIRRGAQKLKASTNEALRQLEYTKGLTSFETEIVAVNLITITNSVPIIEFMLNVIPTAEPSSWLAKQQLVRQGRPTVAGILLFAEEPQAIIPKHCGIKIYRYKTKGEGTRETLAFDPLTVEGHLYKQIRDAVTLTTKTIEEVKRLGDQTLESIQYPTETIHEIITNAALHRDYSLADDIHIRIFDNRIEVESPGKLPAHITVKNILDERFARNGNIVRLLNKHPDPPNKDVGEGLNTAFNAMIKLGLKEPIIKEQANSVLVVIKHERLASPEQVILEYLEANETIRNKTAREICHINADYVVKEIFSHLVMRKLIERVPGTRTASTAYRKGPNFANWRGEIKDKP